jgi:hypothetical protein
MRDLRLKRKWGKNAPFSAIARNNGLRCNFNRIDTDAENVSVNVATFRSVSLDFAGSTSDQLNQFFD